MSEASATETPSPSESNAASTPRQRRKVREGVVTSAGMDKTIVVTVVERVRHARYNKFVLRTKKLYVHDEANDAGAGDRVRVMETRPLSKTKRWRVVEILERAR
jgi:small subunit ribosomal protein S17